MYTYSHRQMYAYTHKEAHTYDHMNEASHSKRLGIPSHTSEWNVDKH